MKIFYMSLANATQFHGACVVEADDYDGALHRCYELFKSVIPDPGDDDQIMLVTLPDDEPRPDDRFLDRVLTREELMEMWPDVKSVRE